MPISKKARARLEAAIAHRAVAKEIADAIDIGGNPGVPVADIATANATDLATAQALANATKTTVNALLASLRAAGLLQP